MLSTKHEDIVDDIREVLTRRYTRGRGTLPWDVAFATDGFMGNLLLGLSDKGNSRTPRADFYIAPNDGGGCIVVEVGTNYHYKWEWVRFSDGQPIRVLYVSFERAYKLEHAIGSDFERDMLEQLKQLQTK